MGNPRKPNHLKSVAGTGRPDREVVNVVDLPLVEQIPEAPSWMPNSHAVMEWDRMVPILMANRLLTEGGLTALAHMCALHGKIVQLYAAGESPTASMCGTLRTMHNDFGLTPVAQGKVTPVGEETKRNKFAANGKRSA